MSATHGTAANYSARGCRCDPCKEAYSIYQKDYLRRKREPGYRTRRESFPRHGTRTGYQKRGCRCDECRAWNAEKSRSAVREYRNRGLEGVPDDAKHGTMTTYQVYLCRCDACRTAWRAAVTYWRYGVTEEFVVETWESQGMACAVCLEPLDKPRIIRDHNHETGSFRGVLCSRCNTGLGKVRDSPEILRSMIEYLERW